ncbi:MAG TPA: sensor histidine kinase [Anaerolineae bacterium]|nr:sensor histidine kinase [Anaerolineae bacterium]
MGTAGIYLIYAAVVLRGVVRLSRERHPDLVVALLALYGLLLLAETWFARRGARRQAPPGVAERPPGARWFPVAYVLAQSGLVVGLLLNKEVLDFFGLLFIPLSVQAVLYFGPRAGFLAIAAFVLAIAATLSAASEGRSFGLVMAVTYGALCFLLGGYADQIHRARMARSQNRRMLGELQMAHNQLQRYAAQMEELAVEQERSRLARDLHDSVTQTVFSMNLTVQSARLLFKRDPGRVDGQIERLEELAADAQREIQVLATRLRATPAVAEGLPAALRRLAAERLDRDGLVVAVQITGECPLSEPVVAGLYRITQEALTNVAKHAGTSHATVRLDLAEDRPALEISDEGLGFDPQTAMGHAGHLGLPGIAEQAGELGWSLSVVSQPGHGTRIRVQGHGTGGAA